MLPAQESSSSPSPTPNPKFDTWKAELPGGIYRVNVAAITSVSMHEYVVDNAARVTEVNIGTSAAVLVRFYAIEPNIPKSPTGIGQNTVDLAKEKAQEALERTKTDDVWMKVVKNYPTTTHARTAEYRLPSKAALQKLFNSVEHAWLQQQSGTFQP